MALSLLAAAPARPAEGGKKHALLVGVAEYNHSKLPDLKYPENDVEELAKILRRPSAGFDSVRLLTSTRGKSDPKSAPTAANIRAALQELVAERGKHDTVVVALAGHGIKLEVQDPDDKGPPKYLSYFCPADADLAGVSYSTGRSKRLVNLAEVLDALDGCGAGVKLMLVDACRNELKAEAASRSPDLGRVTLPEGMAALLSCKTGQRSFETAKLKHGVFFHFVLEGLRGKAKNDRGEVTWSRLAEYVTERVSEDVEGLVGGGARQTPLALGGIAGKSPVLVQVKQESDAEREYRHGRDKYFGLGAALDRPAAFRHFEKAAAAGNDLAFRHFFP
jgi:uncharacterized caspase-like protein